MWLNNTKGYEGSRYFRTTTPPQGAHKVMRVQGTQDGQRPYKVIWTFLAYVKRFCAWGGPLHIHYKNFGACGGLPHIHYKNFGACGGLPHIIFQRLRRASTYTLWTLQDAKDAFYFWEDRRKEKEQAYLCLQSIRSRIRGPSKRNFTILYTTMT